MRKRLVIGLLVLASLGVLLAACQPNSKKDTRPSSNKTEKVYKDMDEFAKAVKKANTKLTSAHADTNMEVYAKKGGDPETVTMTVDAIYKDQHLIRTNTVMESAYTTGELKSHEEMIVPSETEAYGKLSKDGEFEKKTISQKDLENFNLNPDYFDLLEYLYDNTSALSLKEDGDEYVVTLKGDKLSLIQTFGKEYSFRVGGIKEDDMKKELTIRFDKETLFMKELQTTLTYDGARGYIKLLGESKYSKLNEIKEDDIQASK